MALCSDKRSITRSAEAVVKLKSSCKPEKCTYRLKGGDPRDDGISSTTGGDRTAGEFRAKAGARAAVGLGVAHGGSGVPCTERGVEHEGVRDDVGDGLIERNGSCGSDEAENNQIAFDHEFENRVITPASSIFHSLSAADRSCLHTHTRARAHTYLLQLARLPPPPLTTQPIRFLKTTDMIKADFSSKRTRIAATPPVGLQSALLER